MLFYLEELSKQLEGVYQLLLTEEEQPQSHVCLCCDLLAGVGERTHFSWSVGANINQDSLQVGVDVFFGHVEL